MGPPGPGRNAAAAQTDAAQADLRAARAQLRQQVAERYWTLRGLAPSARSPPASASWRRTCCNACACGCAKASCRPSRVDRAAASRRPKCALLT